MNGVGRCGNAAPELVGATLMHCCLPAGHPGWHKGDDGSEWTHGPRRVTRVDAARVDAVRKLIDAWDDPNWRGHDTAAPFVRALRAALRDATHTDAPEVKRRPGSPTGNAHGTPFPEVTP